MRLRVPPALLGTTVGLGWRGQKMFPSRSLVSGLKAMQLSILRPHPPLRLRRHFSPSARPQAAENPDAFISKIKNTAIFQKLADKPDALSALAHFAMVLQDQGLFVVL